MADLGFLPSVRRLLGRTPTSGQRLLFSATLDKAVDVLVKQFLRQPVTHEADSAQSPISTMAHHVLHLEREHRLPVLVDLASAPGRTMVFTRTKHGAKALARQLNANGIPTVDLHGNLSQGARTRNMEMFHAGTATTLVATDVAARGIHVDDVALVVHADPPVGAQGLPAPLGPHRPGRRRRHRRHPDDRRADARGAGADPRRRHQPDDDQADRTHPRRSRRAQARRAQHPGRARRHGRRELRWGSQWRRQPQAQHRQRRPRICRRGRRSARPTRWPGRRLAGRRPGRCAAQRPQRRLRCSGPQRRGPSRVRQQPAAQRGVVQLPGALSRAARSYITCVSAAAWVKPRPS